MGYKIMLYRKIIIIVITGYFLLLSHCFGEQIIEGIVAIVGTKIITISELKKEIYPHLKRIKITLPPDQIRKARKKLIEDMLDHLIKKEIILQSGKKIAVTVTDNQVRERIKNLIRKSTLSEKKFWNVFYKAGWTKEEKLQDIKESLIVEMFIFKEITRNIKITRQEIVDFYKKNISNYNSPETISISQIVLKTKPGQNIKELTQKAEKIIKELKEDGKDFETLAQKHSERTTKLESISLPELSEKIAAAVSKLKVGEISNIIKTDSDLHIVKLEAKKLARNIPLSKAEPTIRRIIMNQKIDKKINKLISEARKKFFIKINI
jgi:parvulin-like peptidyl-prolyl isomerase